MTKMKTKTIVLRTRFPAGTYMQAVESPGLHGTTYDYFYIPREGDEIKAGDFAVVNVASSTRGDGGLKVVQVQQVLTRSTKAEKHALCVFNLEEYRARVDKQERIEALKAEIVERAEAAREREKLLALAESDEGLASLLKELDELQAS